jgi:methionyl-tRNA formyltransferase
MTVDLDAGPILLKRDFVLTPETYIGEIYNFLSTSIPQMFIEAIDGLQAGTLAPRPQPSDPTESVRGFPRLPCDSELNWSQSAEVLARLVRASAEPFAGAYSFLNEERLIIWRASAATLPYPYWGAPGQVVNRDTQTGEVVVLAGEGVLILQEVETASAGRQRATEVIKSMRARLGLLDPTQKILDLLNRMDQLEARLQELASH